LLYWGCSDY